MTDPAPPSGIPAGTPAQFATRKCPAVAEVEIAPVPRYREPLDVSRKCSTPPAAPPFTLLYQAMSAPRFPPVKSSAERKSIRAQVNVDPLTSRPPWIDPSL